MQVFVTGGSGYIGSQLLPALLARKHAVRALVRPGSAGKLPAGVERVIGDALDPISVRAALRPGDTVVHLVGTPHPNPAKAAEFRRVDLGSALATVAAASAVGVAQLVYLSVAQPAPVMRDYIAARAKAEAAIATSGLAATVLRPWYVLGPGHRWPVLLTPLYVVARAVPSLRAGATRLGLVTLEQMVAALVAAVESPPPSGEVRIVEVPQIRSYRGSSAEGP